MVEPVAEPNFIGTLGLNWKLFLAQLVNFGIVLLVLWRWVFRPVAGALEARRRRIEESVKKADEIESRLRALEDTEAQRIKAARVEAGRILKEAEAAANQSRAEISSAAKFEAEKILTDAKNSIAAEKDKMLQEVKADLAELTVMATEKVLRAKLDEKKDREFIEDVIKKL